MTFGPFPPYGSNRPYQGVGGLINTLHGAMVHEPRAEHVSQYAKMLAALTGLQQKEHAESRQRPQGPGGPVAEPNYDTGQGSAEAAAAMAARYAPQHPLQALLGLGGQPVFHPSASILSALRGPAGMGGPVGY